MIFEKIREKIEELHNEACFPCDFVSESQGKVYNYFESKLKEILKLTDEYNNGWIKCEGKTFAVGCKYLIVDKDNDIYIATYLNDNVFIARDKNYFMPIRLEATYCQLLPLPPQPPKGE